MGLHRRHRNQRSFHHRKLQRSGSITYAYPNSNGNTYPHSDTYTYAYANTNANSNGNANTNAEFLVSDYSFLGDS